MNRKETFKHFVENVRRWNESGQVPKSFDDVEDIRINQPVLELLETQAALLEFDPELGRMYSEQVDALRMVYERAIQISRYLSKKTEN